MQQAESLDDEEALLRSFTENCQISELCDKLKRSPKSARADLQDLQLSAYLTCVRKFISGQTQAEADQIHFLLDCLLLGLTGLELASAAALLHLANLVIEVCEFLIIPVEQTLKHFSNEPAALAMAMDLPPLLLKSLGESAGRLQPLQGPQQLVLLKACRSMVRAAHVTLYSERWKQCARGEDFRRIARDAGKTHMKQMLVLISPPATEEGCKLIEEIYADLIGIASESTEIITLRSSKSKHPDFRNFGALNSSMILSARLYGEYLGSSLRKDQLGSMLVAVVLGGLKGAVHQYGNQPSDSNLQYLKFWRQYASRVLTNWPLLAVAQIYDFSSALEDLLERSHEFRPDSDSEGMDEIRQLSQRLASALCQTVAAHGGQKEFAKWALSPPSSRRCLWLGMQLLTFAAAADELPSSMLEAVAEGLPDFMLQCADAASCLAGRPGSELARASAGAVSDFLGCCHRRRNENRGAWGVSQRSLLIAACRPHPGIFCLLLQIWPPLVRQWTLEVAEEHVRSLYQSGAGAAFLASSQHPSSQEFSRTVQQLVHVLASLMLAAPRSLAAFAKAAKLEEPSALPRPHLIAPEAKLALKCLTLALPPETATASQHAGWLPERTPEALTQYSRHFQGFTKQALADGSWQADQAVVADAVDCLTCTRRLLPLLGQAEDVPGLVGLVSELMRVSAHSASAPLFLRPALELLLAIGPAPFVEARLMSGLLHSLGTLLSHPQAWDAVAAFLGQCSLVQPPPTQAFHRLFKAKHWLRQHAVMEAYVTFARGCAAEDARRVVPAEIHTGQDLRIQQLLAQYLQRVAGRQFESAPKGAEPLLEFCLASIKKTSASARSLTAAEQEVSTVSVQPRLADATQAVEALGAALSASQTMDDCAKQGLQRLWEQVTKLQTQFCQPG